MLDENNELTLNPGSPPLFTGFVPKSCMFPNLLERGCEALAKKNLTMVLATMRVFRRCRTATASIIVSSNDLDAGALGVGLLSDFTRQIMREE